MKESIVQKHFDNIILLWALALLIPIVVQSTSMKVHSSHTPCMLNIEVINPYAAGG